MSRVSEIIRSWAEYERLRGESDQWGWLTAELISLELNDGKGQRELGREINKDHKHVAFMARSWQLWGPRSPSERPPFNKAYHSPKVRGSREPTNPPDAITDHEPTNPPMTNAKAGQLIRQANDAVPTEERAWDELRKANGSLIGFRDYLRRDVIPRGVIAEGTIEAFRELVSEIESHLERLS
jgi:hypothetical protein